MVRGLESEVLVVGAGPVGLFAALQLVKRGIGVEIFDQEQRTSQGSYALALHPQTLRLLDELGLGGQVLERGSVVDKVVFYEGARRRAEVDFGKLGGKSPFLLVVRQSVLERVIEDELKRRKVKVQWRHRLQSLGGDADRHDVEIAKLDHAATGYPVAGSEWVVASTFPKKPTFVIGADGYDSSVRRMTGIGTIEAGAPQLFSVFELEAKGELPREVRISFEDGLTSVYCPLEDGRCRWGFEIREGTASGQSGALGQGHLTAPAPLGELLAKRASWFATTVERIEWSTTAFFERRLAAKFGAGSAWLAGDAAHLAGPVGVHSMNVGLREARDLVDKIAAILDGQPRHALLAAYETERQAEWRLLLNLDQRLRALPEADEWVRQNSARILGCLPASGEDLQPLLRQVGLTAE